MVHDELYNSTQTKNESAIPSQKESRPIGTINEMYSVIASPPLWVHQLIDLKPRSTDCIVNCTLKCHHDPNDDIYSLAPPLVPLNNVPRTIVCHDMKNGYLEDRFIDGTDVGNGYPFYLWHLIDSFIYFSHHFITIPPLPWINKAHENGVQILGTFITEWESGELLCKEILKDAVKSADLINGLVKLSKIFKLDGWLINIENVISSDQMEKLKMFIKQLTTHMHWARPESVVLWYDSVIETGDLKWQNELNSYNGCFFDQCDGILLNYSWSTSNLINTKRYIDEISDRPYDVYLGIDVFGRNTSYEAGPGCAKAVMEAHKHNLSTCLFAPGWTHETLDVEPKENFFQRFYDNDKVFWHALWPYLYTRLTTDLFQTDFNIGANSECYKLTDQKLHLLHVPCDTSKICDCLELEFVVNDNVYILNGNYDGGALYHLLALSIQLQGDYILYTDIKLVTAGIKLRQLVIIVEEKFSLRKILCNSTDLKVIGDKNEITCSNKGLDTPNLVDIGDVESVVTEYKLEFPTKVKLRHIYAFLPKHGKILLNGMGLKVAPCGDIK